MPRRLLGLLLTLAAIGSIGVGLILADRPSENAKARTPETPIASAPTSTAEAEVVTTSTNALVVRTVDGDTFVARLDDATEDAKIRLLGVDTPETVDPRKTVQCFGKEASKRTAGLIAGKRVRLESDPQADEHDKYNRLLRNVFLADGTDVNATLVLEGYAHAYLSFPLNRERKKFLKDLETEARTNQRGLWSPTACPQ